MVPVINNGVIWDLVYIVHLSQWDFCRMKKIWQRIDEFGEQICSPSQQPSAADLFYIFIFQNEMEVAGFWMPFLDWLGSDTFSRRLAKSELVKFQSEIQGVQLPRKVSQMISRGRATHGNAASLHKGWTPLSQQWLFFFWRWLLAVSLSPALLALSYPLLISFSALLSFWHVLPKVSDYFFFARAMRTLLIFGSDSSSPPLLVYVQHCWLFSFQHPQQRRRVAVVYSNFTVCSVFVCARVFAWLKPPAPNFQLHFPTDEDSAAAQGKRGGRAMEEAARGWNGKDGEKDAWSSREEREQEVKGSLEGREKRKEISGRRLLWRSRRGSRPRPAFRHF